MVGLLRRKADRGAEPAPPITSRLLSTVLDEKRLSQVGTLNILDFGRANSASLEFFNQYSCRLCVLDAADQLLEWSRSIDERMEEPPSESQMLFELANQLSGIGKHCYDLVFLWDTLNHVHPHALRAFASLLKQHVTAGFRGHGFMLNKKGTEPRLRHMSLAGADSILVNSATAATLHAHSRKAVDEAFGQDLRIDQGVLHGDGRLEYLVLARAARPGR
jgi:hypothetical protein